MNFKNIVRSESDFILLYLSCKNRKQAVVVMAKKYLLNPTKLRKTMLVSILRAINNKKIKAQMKHTFCYLLPFTPSFISSVMFPRTLAAPSPIF